MQARGESFDQRTFEGTEGFEIDMAEFTHTLRTRLGYRGKQKLIKEVFRTLDVDGSGNVSAHWTRRILQEPTHVLVLVSLLTSVSVRSCPSAAALHALAGTVTAVA